MCRRRPYCFKRYLPGNLQVKENSRAEHAGIQVGDVLKSINNVDTSTLTVKEAHDIILESGLEIKLAVTAPDVEETTYFIYQDEFQEELRKARRQRDLKRQKEEKQFKGAKTSEAWSIAWSCNKKRDILYKESNCYLIPSKYEERHPKKITSQSSNDNIGVNNLVI